MFERTPVRDNPSPSYLPTELRSGQHDTGTFEGIQGVSRFLGISAGVRRRIQPNPPAGDVRLREYQHGPWIQLTNRRIEAENAKAEGVIFEKRVFDLAKQAVAGLHGVGIQSCEMTTIANVLRGACKYRALGKEQQRKLSEEKRKEAENTCRVLDACLQFDSRRLASLLGFTIKREKTFGEGVPI
ncbi:unnamed protein product [Pylaiella littoralis]